MSDIEIIHDRIYGDEETKNSKTFIGVYETNREILEKENPSLSEKESNQLNRIISDYALSLYNYGSGRKALPYLDKAIRFFEDPANPHYKNLVKIDMYEALVWARGVENYNSKNYSLAAKDFQYLTKIYPENDRYKNWLAASKASRFNNYETLSFAIAIISSFAFELIITKRSFLWQLSFYTSLIFISLGVFFEILKYIIRIRVRKG